MTIDPRHHLYTDEADLRDHLTEVFTRCLSKGPSPDMGPAMVTLFDLVDQVDDGDPGGLTPAQQDQVVDAWVRSRDNGDPGRLAPGWTASVDEFQHTIDRAQAMRVANRQIPWRQRLAVHPPIMTGPARWLVLAMPVNLVRAIAHRRHRRWFPSEVGHSGSSSRRVVIVPPCDPAQIDHAHDLVQRYRSAGIDCSLSAIGWCGAAWLRAGELARFTRLAQGNVSRLTAEVKAGAEIVVLDEDCRRLIVEEYPRYVTDAAFDEAGALAAHCHHADTLLDEPDDRSNS